MANLKYKNNSDEWKSILSTRGPKGDNADITINGSNLKEASFYAPISSGLIGQALISKGANQSPQWTNLAVVAGTNSYNDLDDKPIIPTTTEELISGSTSVLTSGGAYNAFAQRGIPSGGSAGQVIKKASITDYDFSWADACIDNLASTSIITPLSANQGRILNEKINNIKDYVIETGVSGVWTFEKYLSGKKKAWANVSINTTINLPEGSLFYGDAGYINFPPIFSNPPVVNCSCIRSGGFGTFYTAGSITSTQMRGWLFADKADDETVNTIVSIHLVGN